MEIGVCNRGIPADYHIIAYNDLQFAQQDGVCKVAVMAGFQSAVFTESEVYAIHCAVRTDHQSKVAAATEALECVIGGDNRVFANTRIGRQRTSRPISCLRTTGFHQRASA